MTAPALVLAIVVPTYQRPDLMMRCIGALSDDGYDAPRHLIVVEDGDEDTAQSREIARVWPATINLATGENAGFATAANVGLRYATRLPGVTHVVLLNNDVIVSEGWLTLLLTAMKEERWDFAVPRMCVEERPDVIDGDGDVIDSRGIAVRRHRGQVASETQTGRSGVTFPTGGAAVITVTALASVGLFDEKLRMYYEDVDWGLRAFAIGLRGGVEPRAVVFHRGSATSGRLLAVRASLENFVVVTLSRLPRLYFLKYGVLWLSGVARATVLVALEIGPAETTRVVARVVRKALPALKRRREIYWSSANAKLLVESMLRQGPKPMRSRMRGPWPI